MKELDIEAKNYSYIGALRLWREEDHNDVLVLSRHEVIKLLEEIDARRPLGFN